MGCCGQRRTAIKAAVPFIAPVSLAPQSEPMPPPVAPPTAVVTPPVPRGAVQLEYLEKSRILVTGPATGRRYEFSDALRTQMVDSRDAPPLLRTRFFRLRTSG